jgi:hypothetical protein
MRQAILKGYMYMYDTIKKRFIDAQQYHGLNTHASIKLTRLLMQFGKWLMNNEYPVAILGHMPIVATRGVLDNGFNTYWKIFLSETGCVEPVCTSDDFGPFNKNEYIKETQMYSNRNYTKPAYVVFMQGIQGSGKSTVGEYVRVMLEERGIKTIIVEQDRFYGCTAACQGFLYHSIKDENGPDVIIITRCNTNVSQYRRYLDICHELPSIVIFTTALHMDELYLAISLSGVINRSSNGDLVMIGRKEYTIESSADMIIQNFKDFKKNDITNDYNIYHLNSELLDKAKIAVKRIDHFIDFVKSNFKELHELRLSIHDIADQLFKIIMDTITGVTKNIVYKPTPMYIGMAVKTEDKLFLESIIKKHNHIINYVHSATYLTHCTQLFLGGKKTVPTNGVFCKPLDSIDATINALVIRKTDGACAFRITNDSLMIHDKQLKMDQQSHITGIIPITEKPMISNKIVNKTDDSVIIIPFNYELVLTGFYA